MTTNAFKFHDDKKKLYIYVDKRVAYKRKNLIKLQKNKKCMK